MLKVGEILLFREQHTNLLSNLLSPWSGLKTYIGVTVSRLNCLYIFAYTYMTNNEKRGHELETVKEDPEENLDEGKGKEKK